MLCPNGVVSHSRDDIESDSIYLICESIEQFNSFTIGFRVRATI